MKMLFGLVGGAIGGLIGAAIWAAVGYFTGFEVGWIAWGVGALVGIGVAVGMGGSGGVGGAGTAVLLALLAIVLGKWAVIHFSIQQALDPNGLAVSAIADVLIAEREEQGKPVGPPRNASEPESIADFYSASIWQAAEREFASLSPAEQDDLRTMPFRANPEYLLSYTADGIVKELEAEGTVVKWPPGKDYESAWRESDYPPEIWADAVALLDDLTPGELERYQRDVDAELAEYARLSTAEYAREAEREGFIASLSLFDLLWVVLAVGTAAKIGYGGAGAGEGAVEG